MSGLMERGPDPFDRVYRTRDGWVHVAANHPGETGPAISSRLAKATNDEAVRWGTSVGLTVVEVRSARSLRSAASPTASTTGHSGEVLRVHHPTGDSYAVPAPTWIRSTGPRQLLGPAPRPGQHTLGVLAELGYGDAEVEKLMTAGVVTSSWFTGTRYLPE
jgi:crotonobetainyl-CoA:carnitine CoA-transferase CaiB-like acyl-CoA transferase